MNKTTIPPLEPLSEEGDWPELLKGINEIIVRLNYITGYVQGHIDRYEHHTHLMGEGEFDPFTTEPRPPR